MSKDAQVDPCGPPEAIRTEFNGKVVRAIWNKLTVRPETETFHEFLIDVLKRTVTTEWIREELERPEKEQHAIARWIREWHEQSKRSIPPDHQKGQVFSAAPTGHSLHALFLARDLYYLQLVNKLPDRLVDRLRHPREFQGAWYEASVAAALVMSGFAIEWIEQKSETHCEFIAEHQVTKERFIVEAKSRRHEGVLNEPGEMNLDVETRANRLFRDALQKDPQGLPFAIFVDVNMPPDNSPEDATRRHWGTRVAECAAQHGNSPEQPAKHSLVMFTNFAWHYYGTETATGQASTHTVRSTHFIL